MNHHYNNAVLKVTNQSTPDPWVTYSHGNFYLLFTAGDRVDIWESRSLVDFNNCTKKAVWRPAPGDLHDLWAPELHQFEGTWYIYVAAAYPGKGNESHRMIVLRGPTVDRNPLDGNWEFIGPVDGLPQTQWQIDGTLFWINQAPYFVYSGWPIEDTSGVDKLIQELYIVRLANAYQAASQPVRISTPDHNWEKFDNHAINEGPQWLEAPNGSWKGLVYSCGASWNESYKLNTLQWNGGDPLSPLSWIKSQRPLLTEAPNTPRAGGPHGPGHGSFVTMEHEVFCIYHAIGNLSVGWEDRPAYCQRMSFANGYPEMGGCCGPVVSNVEMFTTGVPQGFGQNMTNQSGGPGHSHGLPQTGHKGLDGLINKAGDKLQKFF